MITVTDKIKYIGVNDHEIDLFEGQYIVPNGMSYNSYLIEDDKCALMDTVDSSKADEWLANLKNTLGERHLDYIVVLHMEPDHSGSLKRVLDEYPDAKMVGNEKTVKFAEQFFNIDLTGRTLLVNGNDSLNLGKHTLTFVSAPMVHWPEVMLAYEQSEKILFAADAFGKFGALDVEEEWDCEARRYYFNIVGKYGAQVQKVLAQAAQLDIQMICPLHGPILKENLGYYINKYDIWSSYRAEDEGVFIAYASIYGHTKKTAELAYEKLTSKGIKASIADLARDDMAEAIEDAFRYDKLILACPTYNGDMFPPMETLLMHLKGKNFQNKKVALIENGTWTAQSGKKMRAEIESMKNMQLCDTMLSIKSAMNPSDEETLDKLINELLSL